MKSFVSCLEHTRLTFVGMTLDTQWPLYYSQGVNPKIVAERLGDSVEITLSVYSHLIPSMQNDAALALEKALA